MSIRKGDILLTGGPQDISSKEDKANKVTSVSESSTDLEYPSAGALYRALLEKQNNLISGTNIKTINGESLLGSGNIEVSGGGSFDPYAYNIQTKQTLDLTNFSSDYFYPVSWGPTLAFVSLDIRSPGLGAANPYNQNRLSASISSMGYSDTPKTINVYESAQYDENEITIYGIYTGNTYGANCVYLRGGLVYEANCNVTLTPHQYEYRHGSGDSTEVFPIMDSSYNFVTTASNIAKVWDAVGWKGYGYTSRGFQSGTAIVGRTLKVNGDTDLTISGPSSGKVNFETIFGSGYVFDKPIKSNGDIISGGNVVADGFMWANGQRMPNYNGWCSDANNALYEGRYYTGNGCINLPGPNPYGHLRVRVSNGDTINHIDNWGWQEFYNTNGRKWIRYIVNNSDWSAWKEITTQRLLYDNTSGTNANLTLNDSAANYDSIEIYFRDNDNNYNSVKVYNPNGKNVTLISQYNNGNNTIWFKIAIVTISGNSITFGNREEVKLVNGSSPSISFSSNIYITKVVGY